MRILGANAHDETATLAHFIGSDAEPKPERRGALLHKRLSQSRFNSNQAVLTFTLPGRGGMYGVGSLHIQTGELRAMHVKGMVQVAGVTYRIVRIERGVYDVVRILDDQRVGQFRTIPRVEVTAASPADATTAEPDATMAEIAKAAVKWGKTSWVGRLSFA
jgi:hypothetical protein